MDFTTDKTYAIEVWFLDVKNTKKFASTLFFNGIDAKTSDKSPLVGYY